MIAHLVTQGSGIGKKRRKRILRLTRDATLEQSIEEYGEQAGRDYRTRTGESLEEALSGFLDLRDFMRQSRDAGVRRAAKRFLGLSEKNDGILMQKLRAGKPLTAEESRRAESALTETMSRLMQSLLLEEAFVRDGSSAESPSLSPLTP